MCHINTNPPKKQSNNSDTFDPSEPDALYDPTTSGNASALEPDALYDPVTDEGIAAGDVEDQEDTREI